MVRSFCKRLVLLPINSISRALMMDSSNTHLQLVLMNPSFITIKPFSSSASLCVDQQSFVVSYLMNSCGLPHERALHIASSLQKKLNFKNPEKPDQVLEFLKSQGFSDTHIRNFVIHRPLVLISRNPIKMLPKLEFLYSIGFSKSELLDYVSWNPGILSLNVEKNLRPTYEFVKSVLGSDKRVVYALRRGRILSCNHSKNLRPNIEFLRSIGVTDSNIALLLTNFPGTLLSKHEFFLKCVDKLEVMQFDVSKSMFVVGLYVVSRRSYKTTSRRCVKAYKSWGWSDDEILVAFRIYPQCMLFSDYKIMRTMDFLVNKMGFKPGEIAGFPVALGSSLEKTIIPRCAVIRVLLSKGLIENWKFSCVLLLSKELFVKRFVTKFSKEAPELLSVYDGKVDVFKA